MPGISGIMGSIEPQLAREKLNTIAGSMWKEPFYNYGTYINSDIGVYLHWSCHQESFSDCMPIWNENKNLALVFSGEDFHDHKEIEEIKNRGHNFDLYNASYLIHAYEEKGREQFLKWLNGWFCGIIIDLRQNAAFVFNDRYGLGRVYYYEESETFYFSSETKSILGVCSDSRAIDKRGLGEYLACGCVLENRTLFQKIYTMPPGSVWKYDQNYEIKKDLYFCPVEWENQQSISKEVFFSKFRDTLAEILPRYFCANSQIGFSLTGGLDTRMILASYNTISRSLPCYTFGGMDGDIYDIKIARRIAKICDQDYNVLRLQKDFFNTFEGFAVKTILVTDGAVDISVSHEIYLNSLARQVAPIRMTGNYGGEVLRGVSTFKSLHFPIKTFDRDFYKFIIKGKAKLNEIKKNRNVSFVLFKEIPWRHFGTLAAAQSQVTFRTPYLDNDLVRIVYQAPMETLRNNKISLRILKEKNEVLSNIPTDQGVGGNKGYLLGSLIHGFHYLTFKAEYYLNDGMPKLIANASKYQPVSFFEKIFLGKHKYLFYRRWYRRELSNFIKSVLLDNRHKQRSYLNKNVLEIIVDDHLKGKANHTDLISKLVSIELIQNKMIQR